MSRQIRKAALRTIVLVKSAIRLSAFCFPVTQFGQTPQHQLDVMVLDPVDNPVSGAKIVFESNEQKLLKEITTDQRGRASFDAQIAGKVRLTVYDAGFTPHLENFDFSQNQNRKLYKCNGS